MTSQFNQTGRRFLPALVLSVAAATALVPSVAHAGPSTANALYGETVSSAPNTRFWFDADFGVNALPANSNAKQAYDDFGNNVSGVGSAEDFEFKPADASVSSLSFTNNGMGVTATGFNTTDVPPANPNGVLVKEGDPSALNGFATSGTKRLQVSGTNNGTSVLRFDFTDPGATTFGAYFSGVNDRIGNLLFQDGTTITFTFNDSLRKLAKDYGKSEADGGVFFFGFQTDKALKYIEFVNAPQQSGNPSNPVDDLYSIDDVRVGRISFSDDPNNPLVPEPAFYQMGALIGFGVLGMVGVRRRRKGVAAA